MNSENPIWAMLDLVALATVADVAPLRGETPRGGTVRAPCGFALLFPGPAVGDDSDPSPHPASISTVRISNGGARGA